MTGRPRKTPKERDLIDVPIAIRATKSRLRKIALVREFQSAHGEIPDELLEAFGQSEWSRGWDEGVHDANYAD